MLVHLREVPRRRACALRGEWEDILKAILRSIEADPPTEVHDGHDAQALVAALRSFEEGPRLRPPDAVGRRRY